ncbi:MAG: hypothetical protein R3B99_18480 [Polyangiales bacterium]
MKLFEDACDRATGTRPDLTGRPTLRAVKLVKAHPWETLERSIAAFEQHLGGLSPEARAQIDSYFAVWASDVVRWPERVAAASSGRRHRTSRHLKPDDSRAPAPDDTAARASTQDIVAELRGTGRKRALA